MSGTLTAPCTFVFATCISGAAYAHELPHAVAVGFSDTTSGVPSLVLTNRGVITRAGEGWALRCNESYSVNTAASVTMLGYEPSWGWTLATPSSVLSSNDGGCGFTDRSPTANAPTSVALSTQSTWYVATGLADNTPALYVRGAHGGEWSTQWTSDDGSWIDSLAQAPGDPNRLYATFLHPNYATRTLEAAWGTSTDGGRNWARSAVPSRAQVVGVHPSDAEVVFAQEVREDETFALKRSDDAGASFVDVATGASPFGPLLRGPDGKLWLGGGTRGGLLASDDEGRSFARIHREVASVHCLVWSGHSLYACANVQDQGEGIYRVADDTKWIRVLSFTDVREASACSEQAVCEAAWADWADEVLTDESSAHTSDAGHDESAHSPEGDHDQDLEAPSTPSDVGAGSCAAYPASSRHRAFWSFILLFALAASRRPFRSPRTSRRA